MKRIRGDRVRLTREELNLTQDELANLIGAGVQQINRYENLKTEPDADTVARLATALSVSTDYLLGLTDDPRPPALTDALNARERVVLLAWRKGNLREAIKVMVNDE